MSESPSASEKARLEHFLAWLRANGVVFLTSEAHAPAPLVRIEHLGATQGFGVLANEDLEPGCCVCHIPKAAVLSRLNCSITAILKAEPIWRCRRTCLIVCGLFERSLGERSRWNGYFRIIPEYEDLPALWTGEDRKLLEGTDFATQIEVERRKMLAKHAKLVAPLVSKYPDILDEKAFSFEKFVHMNTLIESRAFHVDSLHGDAFVPLADMFNHTSYESIHIEGDETPNKRLKESKKRKKDIELNGNKGESVIHAASEAKVLEREDTSSSADYLDMMIYRPVKKDIQIFNTFGPLDNYHLAYQYGFTDENNPHESISVKTEKVIEVACKLLTEEKVDRSLQVFEKVFGLDEEYQLDLKEEINGEFLCLLRVLFASDIELEKWRKSPSKLTNYLSKASELSILQIPLLAQCIKSVLEIVRSGLEKCPAFGETGDNAPQGRKAEMVRVVLGGRIQVVRHLMSKLE